MRFRESKDRGETVNRIVVVGSGVSGAHAALTLLERGHDVELWDVGREEKPFPEPGATFHELKDRLADPVTYFLGADLGALVPPTSPELLRYPPAREFMTSSPVWSPDASQIAYTALRDGTFSVYRKSANGQGAEELIYKLPGITAVTDWSQDGRYLTYHSTDLGGGTLYALPLDVSAQPARGVVPDQNNATERKPIEAFRSAKQVQGMRLSPDDHFLAYTSNESGRLEVYIQPFPPTGAKYQITATGARFPMWSPDGRQIFYIEIEDSQGAYGRIVSVDVRTTKRSPLATAIGS